MKDLNLIVWLTQLGMSVVAPFVCAVLLALWLQNRFGLGRWVLWVGIVLGVVCAIDGFCSSIKIMSRLSKGKKDPESPPVCFNDHD